MVPLKLVFVFSLAIVCLGKESKDPMVLAFQRMNNEEKTDFLSYFLALGLKDWAESQPRPPKFTSATKTQAFIKSLEIPEENIQKFEKLNIPKESRVKLLEWTKSEFNLTTRNVLDLLKTKKPQGPTRVGFPDIGGLCCPW